MLSRLIERHLGEAGCALVLLSLLKLRHFLVLHVLQLLPNVLVLLQQLLHLYSPELLLLFDAQLNLLAQCLQLCLLLLSELVQQVLDLLVAIAAVSGEFLLLQLVDAVLHLMGLQIVLLFGQRLFDMS